MFPLLTKYLLQFKKVAIPHIGGFEIIRQPAEISIGEQILYPPKYAARFLSSDHADAYQINHLATVTQISESALQEQLNSFGAALKNRLQTEAFSWNGIGQFTSVDGVISFHAEPIAVTAFQAVQAAKVIRENATHDVLIGEQEMQSDQAKEMLQESNDNDATAQTLSAKNKRRMTIAYIIAGLAIAFIAYYCFSNGTQNASGYKAIVNAPAPQPTYH